MVIFLTMSFYGVFGYHCTSEFLIVSVSVRKGKVGRLYNVTFRLHKRLHICNRKEKACRINQNDNSHKMNLSKDNGITGMCVVRVRKLLLKS